MIEIFLPELLQLLITFGLFILIWLIQLSHYPSFLFYEDKKFSKAMNFHQRWIVFTTLPLMISELLLTLFIFYKSQNLYSTLNLVIVCLIWLSTFFIQVPLHEKLLLKKDSTLIKKLVKTNWIRTVLWSLKLGLLIRQLYL